MGQAEQLTKLIEAALEKGWTPPWNDFGQSTQTIDFHAWERGVKFNGSFSRLLHLEIETLLFGGELSFLKALAGEDHDFQRKTFEWDPGRFNTIVRCTHCGIDDEDGPYWLTCTEQVATSIVLLAESERIPYIYSQVFGGES